ncbi:MAG: glycosyltransferase family 2 protein, partial [Nanoarchaeota archaeon]
MKKVSITLTRYNEENDLVRPCLLALSKQKFVGAEVYFFDQKEDRRMKEFCSKISNKNIRLVYKKIPAKSLSHARNIGIKTSKTDIVLFIDCDAIPDKKWAFNLAKVFELDKRIAIVGGRSNPKWLKKPRWFHNSNIAREVYSLIDLSEKIIETSRIV